MKELLFSVVITTCNRESAILKDAIDSVFAQSYKQIEVIVVNDAPLYENRKEIDELIKKYGNRIKYIINESTKGANYSRNLGASLSKGEILSFLDDDDFWDAHRVEKVINAIKRGADIVYSDIIILSDKNKRYSASKNPLEKDKLSMILAYNYLRGFSNVSFTKNIFKKAGSLDETAVAYQDLDLFIRMVPLGKVYYIAEPLSYYRISDNSISLDGTKKYKGLMHILDKYADLYEKYPKSKCIKLKNDYVNALRNGWKEVADDIGILLLPLVGRIGFFKIYIKGSLKFWVLNCIKLIKRRHI